MSRRIAAFIILWNVFSGIPQAFTREPQAVPFEIERSVVLKREPGVVDGSYWMHPRAAIIPADSTEGRPQASAMMVLFRYLGRSDHYSGLYTMRSRDAGATWNGPRLEEGLDWIRDEVPDMLAGIGTVVGIRTGDG